MMEKMVWGEMGEGWSGEHPPWSSPTNISENGENIGLAQ